MYTRTIDLKDHESLFKVNKETGELTELSSVLKSLPDNMEVWLPTSSFHKTFDASWKYLTKALTSDELKVVTIMSLMASPNTNSLSPLNEEASLMNLANFFNINKNKIKKILDNLFDIGVFARFEVVKVESPYTKYWILNPYISFKGKLANSDVAKLFNGTQIHIEYLKNARAINKAYYCS